MSGCDFSEFLIKGAGGEVAGAVGRGVRDSARKPVCAGQLGCLLMRLKSTMRD